MLRRRRGEEHITELHQHSLKIRRKVTAGMRSRNAPVPSDDDFDAAFNQALWRYTQALGEGQEIEKPEAWLTTTTVRELIDMSRRAKVDRTDLAEHEDLDMHECGTEALDESLHLAEASQHALRALRRLGEREQQAIVLHRLDGLSYEEVGEHLGISARAAKKACIAANAVLGEFSVQAAAGDLCGDMSSGVRAYARAILKKDGPRYHEITEHLRTCPHCRSEVKTIRGLQSVVPPTMVPLLFADNVIRRLGALLGRTGEELTSMAAIGGGTATVAATGGSAVTAAFGTKAAVCAVACTAVAGGVAVERDVVKVPSPEKTKTVKADAAKVAKRVVSPPAPAPSSSASASSSPAAATGGLGIGAVKQKAQATIAVQKRSAAKQRERAAARREAKQAAAKKKAAAKQRDTSTGEFGLESSSAAGATAPSSSSTPSSSTPSSSTPSSGGSSSSSPSSSSSGSSAPPPAAAGSDGEFGVEG